MASTQDPYAELRALEREFFRIDDDVVRRIRKLKPRLMEYAAKALDTVFDHLRTNPIVADYFADEDNLAFLTSGMLSHCDRVLSARFDADYYEAVSQMGLRHSKLAYPSFVYTAAYSNMLTSMQEQAAKDRKRFSEEDAAALNRVALYDVELAQSAFFQHQIEKVRSLNADMAKVQHLIDRPNAA